MTRQHERFVRMALELAGKCRGCRWYSVGSVISSPAGELIATGYTNELEDEDGKGRHAEDCAILKAQAAQQDLTAAILYSTLEPCSVRASGKTSCVERILAAGLGTVVYGTRESFEPALGIVCEGHKRLAAAGVKVIELTTLGAECAVSILRERPPLG